MIRRGVAVLVLLVGAAGLAGGLVLLGRAPGLPEETRHLRAMKDRVTAPATYRDVDLDFLVALPHDPPLAERARIEDQGVRVDGSVQLISLSGDGDLHLEIVAAPRAAADRDTAYVVGEVTPQWRTGSRGWSYDSLLVAFRPNRGGPTPWPEGTRRVRVSGWLNYDHPYDRPPSSWLRLHGAPRLTGWEIHPVTRIELWDATTMTWQELAR